MWRCYVCNYCKIVSWHPITYCPNCPRKVDRVEGPSAELMKRFPEKLSGGEYTPAEFDRDYEQPWTKPGYVSPASLRWDNISAVQQFRIERDRAGFAWAGDGI